MSKCPKVTGQEKFNQYYSNLYKDRWESLKSTMQEETNPIELAKALDLPFKCYNEPYYMDRASILAAFTLPVKENDKVLDMCAAPGGKTLVLASKLKGTGSLISNDRSSARRNRLNTVIKKCLTSEMNKNIKTTGYDSTQWSLHEKNEYNCILLDAPCSSERHVLNDNAELKLWSETRPKRLAIQQFAMLAAALDAVVESGYILYSTCSINPIENEAVIEKLEKKRAGMFEEIFFEESFIESLNETSKEIIFNLKLGLNIEKLSHGQIILPDASKSSGPLYFCLLRKLSPTGITMTEAYS